MKIYTEKIRTLIGELREFNQLPLEEITSQEIIYELCKAIEIANKHEYFESQYFRPIPTVSWQRIVYLSQLLSETKQG